MTVSGIRGAGPAWNFGYSLGLSVWILIATTPTSIQTVFRYSTSDVDFFSPYILMFFSGKDRSSICATDSADADTSELRRGKFNFKLHASDKYMDSDSYSHGCCFLLISYPR